MKRLLLLSLMILTVFAGVACRRQVASAPPPPPPVEAPPPPASPVVTLSADRTTINEGESVTLQWSAQNATSLNISEIGNVDMTGSRQLSPTSSTSYVATATGPGGTATDTVRITVAARPAPPPPAPPAISLDQDFLNNVQDVLFDYDRAELRPDQMPKLEALTRWLRQNMQTRIVIEGHADERGSQEYNIGLGDRRASAVRRYLESQGIAASRLEVVSYGEDRPACSEQNEACWSRNRRAHFVLRSTT